MVGFRRIGSTLIVAVGPVVVYGTVVLDRTVYETVVLDRTVYGTVVLDRTVYGTVVLDRTVDGVGSTSPGGATTLDRADEVVGAAADMEVAPHATASNRLPDQATDRTADPIRD